MRWRRVCALSKPRVASPTPTPTHPLTHAHAPHAHPTQSGKTKFTIENATKTRIVLADTRIHILGSFQNIRVARDALCSLILGSPAGKVYSKLRSVCARLNHS